MNIEPGDLVMLVRGHSCAVHAWGGVPFTVEKVGNNADMWYCPLCGERNIKCGSTYVRWNNSGCLPQSFLIKIDPPAIPAEKEVAITA